MSVICITRVFGDSNHGDTKVNRWWRENTSANRLGLHCFRIDLQLPSERSLSVTCPLFEDQYELFSHLPWWEAATKQEPDLLRAPLPLLRNPEKEEESDPA